MNCYNLTAAIFLNNVGINLLESNEVEGAMSLLNDAVDILHEHEVVPSSDQRIIRGDQISLHARRLRNPTIFRNGIFLNVINNNQGISNPIAIMVDDSHDDQECNELCTAIIFYNQALTLISACQQGQEQEQKNQMFTNVAMDFLKTALRQSVGNLESSSTNSQKALFSTMVLQQLIQLHMSLGQNEELQEYVCLCTYMKSRAAQANNHNNSRRNHTKLVIEVDSNAAAA